MIYMKTVGITGGIGSGKSFVCRYWQQMGTYVVYADQLAKQLMVSDPILVNSIKKQFGEDSYSADGQLNRRYLSQKAFSEDRVEELNKLVHPRVYKRIDEEKEDAAASRYKIFVVESALMLKHGRPSYADIVVLILSNEALRIQRVANRDFVAKEEVRRRMRHQMDYEKCRELADYIIENNSDESNLMSRSFKVYKEVEREANAETTG